VQIASTGLKGLVEDGWQLRRDNAVARDSLAGQGLHCLPAGVDVGAAERVKTGDQDDRKAAHAYRGYRYHGFHCTAG
jgi:hypothetical protein